MSSTAQESELTVSQAARRLGISTDWVRHLCDCGELPHKRVGNGWRLIPAAAVDALIHRREAEQRAKEHAR